MRNWRQAIQTKNKKRLLVNIGGQILLICTVNHKKVEFLRGDAVVSRETFC
jgi:hypothetical protein